MDKAGRGSSPIAPELEMFSQGDSDMSATMSLPPVSEGVQRPPRCSTEEQVPPALCERVILILALLVQQGAFVSLPMILADLSMSDMREVENPFNTAAVGISVLLVGYLS